MHSLILGYLCTRPSLLLVHNRFIDERITSNKQIPILVHFILLLEILFILLIGWEMAAGLYHSPGCFLNFPRFCVNGPTLRRGRPFSIWCLDCFFSHSFGCLRKIIKEEIRFHDGISCRRGSSPTTHGRLSPLENVLSIHD